MQGPPHPLGIYIHVPSTDLLISSVNHLFIAQHKLSLMIRYLMNMKTLTIKAINIPKHIKKFNDYTKLVLVDGDFDEYDVDLDESIFNLSEYYGKFETIKTLHFKNWHTDDTFFPHKTLEEISCLFPDIEKIIIEDFKENELVFSTDSLLDFEYLREIKLINSQLPECSGEGGDTVVTYGDINAGKYSDDLYKLECLERTDSLSIQSEEKLHNFKNLKFIKNLFIQRINVAKEFIEVVKNYEIENLYINYCKKESDIKLLKDNFSNMKKIPEHSKWVVENL